MNTAEHIVECYFRIVRKCFTVTDVKVIDGNNRQCDLIAVDIKNNKYYHVETSVTHRKMWAPDVAKIEEIFDKKFRGIPPQKDSPKSDWKRGINYFENIKKTYKSFGMPPNQVNRIFVCWFKKDKESIDNFLRKYKKQYGLKVNVLSLRDDILPELIEAVGTSYYDDEILRTISFFKETGMIS